MSIATLVIIIYAITWLIMFGCIYINWLDIKTTQAFLANGSGVEGNPDQIPYVKLGKPWLQVWGKLTAGGDWVSLISFICPLFVFIPVIKAFSTWKAVKGNEKILSDFAAAHKAQ